ncbi:MAG: hypothetical protein ACPGLV_13020 [Bacteroidia bacterium]
MNKSRLIIFAFTIFLGLASIKVKAQVNGDGSMQYYKRDFQYGVALHTRGFSINTKYCIDKNYNVKRQFDIDWVLSMKHFREFTYRNTGARAFVFGKKNSLSILRATWGQQRVIADFENSMSVRVNLHYGIGPNLGIMKPEYYRIANAEGGFDDVKFDEQQHFYAGQFYGGSKWTKGLSELGFTPGITGKLAMSFEWGKQDDQFKSFETGLMVDVYGHRIPIMAFTQNDFVFINLYAAFMIGSRW